MTRIQDSRLLLTAGGTETYLQFVQKFPLREFCAFEVFEDDKELSALETACISPVLDAGLAHGHDVLLDVMAWRAHSDFVHALGYPDRDVERFNRIAVEKTRVLIARWRAQTRGSEYASVFVNGDIGPRGDGYRVTGAVSVQAALDYHRRQIQALAVAGVDVISGLTMTNVNEAIGIALAAREVGRPCIISPTIEIDGTTAEGLPLGQFIEEVEDATAGYPLFYMVNCAHPIHVEPTLHEAREHGESWLARFRGFRANASSKSHAELDRSTELDRGHPLALASQMAHLCAAFDLRLIGGCCGTDAEHISAMAQAVRLLPRDAIAKAAR